MRISLRLFSIVTFVFVFSNYGAFTRGLLNKYGLSIRRLIVKIICTGRSDYQ